MHGYQLMYGEGVGVGEKYCEYYKMLATFHCNNQLRTQIGPMELSSQL